MTTESGKIVNDYVEQLGDVIIGNAYLQKVHMVEMSREELETLMSAGIKVENYEACAVIRDIIKDKYECK